MCSIIDYFGCFQLVIQDKRLDTKTQMAKAGIQVTDDGTILLDNYVSSDHYLYIHLAS